MEVIISPEALFRRRALNGMVAMTTSLLVGDS